MSTLCARDGSPTGDGAVLCDGCGKWLAARLMQLALYTEDVAAAVGRQRAGGQHMTDYDTQPAPTVLLEGRTWGPHRQARRAHWTPGAHSIPLDESAALVGKDIWDVATWAGGMVASGMVPTEPTSGRARGMLMLAAERVDVLRMEEAAGDLCDSVESVIKAAMWLIDAPFRHQRPRLYLGECACGAVLRSNRNAEEAVCARCGLTHEVEQRQHEVRRVAEDEWVNLRDARDWVEFVTGEVIPQGTLDSWLKRDKLSRNGAGQVVVRTLMDLQERRMGLRVEAAS